MDKLLFTKHLSTMIKSGITISEALQVISDQASSRKFKRIIYNIDNQIRKGQRLSTALSSFPSVFDTLFINIVNVGEESGTLVENLEYLSSDLEEKYNLKKAIKAAAFYPSIVLSATFGLVLLLAYFVLPKITKLFKTLKFELPLTTKILLFTADLFENYGNIIIAIAIVTPFIIYFITRLKFIKPLWHWLLLKLPVIGKIISNYNLAIITRTINILLKSGIPVDRSLTITAETVNNKIYSQKLTQSIVEVQEGKRFSKVLQSLRQSKRKPLFPLLVIKMLGVGEKSGQLEESAAYLARYYEKEVGGATKNLTVILEPILLVVIGLIVGFVAISIITPIYQITGQFGR